MRILLDECLPKRLKRDLVGHEAKSVPEMGWAGKTNGTLLALAQVDFDVFLTVDRNLSFQQDLNKFSIAVVVLVAKSNKRSALQPLISSAPQMVLRRSVTLRPRCLAKNSANAVAYKRLRETRRRVPSVSAESASMHCGCDH